MLNRVDGILFRQCKLDPDQPTIVGVSGGPDSLCLLDILQRLGYRVICAHLNHGLRPESAEEAAQVAHFSDEMGIPFVRSDADVLEYAQDRALSVEEAARILRYEFLFRQAHKENAQAVAVGHNADDQVETVLMHLLRGAGLAGLRGMSYHSLPNAWDDKISLVRPLLGVWRSEVLAYCRDQQINPVFDQSNLDQTYFRNRLRHDLIPSLTEYNPRIKEILFRTADILSADYEVIAKHVEKTWEVSLFAQGEGYLALRIDLLSDMPLGIQRYVIRKAITCHRPGLRDIDFDTIERTIHFMLEPTETLKRDLAAGLMIYHEDNLLWIAERGVSLPTVGFPAVRGDEFPVLKIPGRLPLGYGWEINAKIVKLTDELRRQVLKNQDSFRAWLDASKLVSPLQIRSRTPGDRFQPLGMAGKSVKISDFMVNEKIPRRARKDWPLVISEGKIIWVPGYHIHHDNRITDNTESVVVLNLSFRERMEKNLE